MDVNESMDHLKRNIIFSKIAVNVFDGYYLCVDYAEGCQLPYFILFPLSNYHTPFWENSIPPWAWHFCSFLLQCSKLIHYHRQSLTYFIKNNKNNTKWCTDNKKIILTSPIIFQSKVSCRLPWKILKINHLT